MRPIFFLPLSVTWLLLPSCGKKADEAKAAPPPAHVSFVPAASETVTITRDLPGRVDAVKVAEIRARVSGILLKKTFQEGADVKAGDILFQIDPAPLESALANATAALTRSEATAKQAENQVTRFRELVSVNAVSKQDADDAESAVAIAAADVLAAKASVASSDLNLGYATVTAPISGRIGKAQVTEGALVGEGSPTLMATIQQLDPIYVDFTQSSADMIAMKKAMAGKSAEESKVTLILEDGSEYDQPGKILFSEATVDRTTGMVLLRAEFKNPDGNLLPGMFARARVVQSVTENAVTVPQRTVTRAAGGAGTVMVVDEANKAQIRTIQTSEPIGDKWVVTDGLKAGDRVIMEGHLKAMPGSEVVAEPYAPKDASAPSGAAQH